MYVPLEAINANYCKERLVIIALINQKLFKSTKEAKLALFKEREQIVMSLESSIFKKTIEIETVVDWNDPKFIQTYSREAYRIIEWIEKCEFDRVANCPDQVAFMSTRDLSPELYLSHENDIAIRSGQKIETKTSKQFKCRKCGKSETIIEEVQMRSFDEGATITATCNNCSHHWYV